MRVRLVEIERRERPYRLRMPFRFGVTTATHGRQAIVRARIRLEDGREATGWSAEALGAKWFDKNTSLTDAENHHQLRRALELASDAYIENGWNTPFGHFATLYGGHLDRCADEALGAKWFDKNTSLTDAENHHQLRRALELASDAYIENGWNTPFGHFATLYGGHLDRCADEDLNALIASYGQSLVDRAVLDGFCRALGVSFDSALRQGMAGLGPADVAPELASFDFSRLFAGSKPAERIAVRHTVGLADPILSSEIAPDARINDGLPQSLEEVVAFYGNRYFKLKIGGDADADIDRLERIAAVLDRAENPYFVTLDGNEQYSDAEAIAAFHARLCERASLKRLAASILFVEQPVNRARALSTSIEPLARRIPVIIDESDGELSAFVTARGLGYTGVSSKACKGIWKSILNLARCRMWNDGGRTTFFMSAEDLTCEPGIAIQQDLALVNLLGLTHVERNAHHFIDGFGGRPEAEARAFLAAHPDLYHDQDGRVRLRIDDGYFQIGSIQVPGFGASIAPDFDAAEPMPPAAWPRIRSAEMQATA